MAPARPASGAVETGNTVLPAGGTSSETRNPFAALLGTWWRKEDAGGISKAVASGSSTLAPVQSSSVDNPSAAAVPGGAETKEEIDGGPLGKGKGVEILENGSSAGSSTDAERNPVADTNASADGKVAPHTVPPPAARSLDDGTTSNNRKGKGAPLTDAAKPNGSVPPARGPISKVLTSAVAAVASRALWLWATIGSNLPPARAAFLLLTSLALWSAADRPRRAVYTFTVIAASYLALWTIYFTAKIRTLTVLGSVSYIALLASAVAHLSSAASILVMLLDAAYAAGLLGYAVSDYRQCRGLERAAEAIPTRLSEEEREEEGCVIAVIGLYATVTSLACAAGAAYVVLYCAADMYWMVVLLSLLIDLSLFCWTGVVGVRLWRRARVPRDRMTPIYWSAAALFVPDYVLSCLFGKAIGVLVHPAGVMGMAGFLGYNLGIYGRYKDIVALAENREEETEG